MPLSAHSLNQEIHSIHCIFHYGRIFQKGANLIYAVETSHKFSEEENKKLRWLFDGATPLASTSVKGRFIGPRKEMITPSGAPMRSKLPRTWVLKESPA